jgi:hypothetical protein
MNSQNLLFTGDAKGYRQCEYSTCPLPKEFIKMQQSDTI